MKSKSGLSGIIIVGVLALLIGLAIAIQVRTTESSDIGGLIPVAKVEGLEAELAQVRAEKEAISQELMDMEDKLDQIQKESITEDDLLKSMSEDLDKYKMSAGVVDVEGPGLTITLDDPISSLDSPGDGYSTIMLRYELLLSLVNKLKEAGAEAISINGQRVINSTEISLAGNNVYINATPTAPPYNIKAIGDPTTMESTLTIRFGVVDTLEGYGIQVEIKKSDNIKIGRYTGTIKFRYAEPTEE